MAERDLIIRIIGDDASYQRALDRSAGKTRTMTANVQGLGRTIGTSFVAATVGVLSVQEAFDQLGASITNATNLNEQVSKSREIFGAASRDIEAWSETTASAFGISQAAALEATGTFGNLFAVVDLAPEQAALMSQALVELAADLASFNNADPSDVLTAIRSGLIGEAEPLRRYGVLLSEARVQQQALATTGKLVVADLTAQEKAMARYELIIQDTAIAQGDFNRTSDSLANQSRILRANFDDLSASAGSRLVPALEHLASSANSLFDLFDRGDDLAIEIDTSNAEKQIEEIRLELEKWGPVINSRTEELRRMLAVLEQVQETSTIAPNEGAGARGFGAIQLSNAEVDRKNLEEAERQLRKSREDFAEFMKGLGLKLDKAGLTKTFADDAAALAEMERAILRQIQREGHTFALEQQLVNVRLRQNQLREAGAKTESAATRRSSDSIIEERRKAREARREAAEALSDRRQADQFRTLGLTAEGQQRVPSGEALRRRADALEERLKGTVLDTEKNRRTLNRIQAVLKGDLSKVGREVRQAILNMLNDISGAFDEGAKKQGPLTKTSGLSTTKFLEGLGLSPDQIRELRGRLSSLNTAGQGLGNFQVAPATASAGFGGAQGAILVESHTTINLDGQQVANVVTRQQQKTKRRNPSQKRGPNRNR